MMLDDETIFNLARAIHDDVVDFTEDEVLDMELVVMDALAVKRAGGDHLVHWDAAQLYQ